MRKIEVPIYGGKVYLFDNLDKAKIFIKKKGGELDVEDCHGCCAVFQDGYYPGYMIYVGDGTLSTLVHELQHLLIVIAQSAGFNVEDGNGEPICYLASYLFEALRKEYVELS